MSNRRLTFHGGVPTALGFVVAFAAALLALVPVKDTVADASPWAKVTFEFGTFAVLAAIGLVALRREGVRLADLGLSLRHLLPGVAAFGSVWVALNVLGAGIAAMTGNAWSIGLVRETTPILVPDIPAPWVTTLVHFLVVGVVEELLFRGYFQSKVVALIGDDAHFRIVLGVVVSALVFGLGHVPGALVAGTGARGVLSLILITAASGVAFGVLYEITRNLYFLALLHALGNTWPMVVDWTSWSGGALGAFLAGVLVVYLAAALAYRYWALDTDLTPRIRRTDSRRLALLGGESVPAETSKSDFE
jgi:membrane protease YdiL (CAAX protease family)